MNKIFWMIVAVVVLITSLAVIKYGMRPQPIPIIKPSSFDHPEMVGEVIYKQTRQRLREEPFLVVGVDLAKASHLEILEGILTYAEKDQSAYSKIIWTLNLPSQSEEFLKSRGVKKVDLLSPDFEQAIGQALSSGARTLIVLEQNSAVHGTEPIERLEKLVGHPVYSLAMAETAIDKNEVMPLPKPCTIEDEFERILSHNLGCYVLRQTLVFSFNKRFKRDRFVASYEQMGTNQYVLYTHSP